jgi:hypothetical protein
MKKLLLLILVVCTTIFGANAQCTPDGSFTEPGVYPDSATGMAPACVDTPYSEVITVVVPIDTTVVIIWPITFPMDSVAITNWTGLPASFSYSCSAASNVVSPTDACTFEGGTSGCISLVGNPTVSDIGSFQQVITTTAYVPGSPGNPHEIIVDYYYLHITDCSLGTNAMTKSKFLVYPNPSNGEVFLSGLNDIDLKSVVVTSASGQVMANYDVVSSPLLNLNATNFDAGMYFVTINYNGQSEVIKFIKE